MQNRYEIVDISVNDLKPAAYNPRRISTVELKKIVDSVREFGMVDDIVVNKDFTVIGGHQRLKAAMELGWKTVPCKVVALSKKDEKRLNLKLNRLGGEFDDELLKTLLEGFDEAERAEVGFEAVELEKIMGDKNMEDANKEIKLEELGDPKNVTCPECGHQFEV